MSSQVADLIVIGCVVAAIFWHFSLHRETKSDSQALQGTNHVQPRSYHVQTRTCSNHGNNHDHLKYKHASRASAEAEVRRMQSSRGYPGSERLRAYYNPEHTGYFVGNGKYDW
jgi:ribosomal protein L37E